MQEYSRLVGIDVGKKRIGIAQTDLLQTIASPVGTFSPEEVFPHLKKITEQSAVEKFIVGWPLMPDGSEGSSIDMVKEFIKKLENEFPGIPVHKADERNTSTKAMRLMIEAGVSKKKRREKERVDRIAAAVILQNYLDEIY
ncbi:MAG: Holliday junction resolvase RuvX [Balneola sp.]